jgi:hypothetical protein
MVDASEPLITGPVRKDGWTLERRRRFLALLAAGLDVRRACDQVGMSRQAAYRQAAAARAGVRSGVGPRLAFGAGGRGRSLPCAAIRTAAQDHVRVVRRV